MVPLDSVAAHAQWAALSAVEPGTTHHKNFQRVLISDPDVPSIHLQLHPSGYVLTSAIEQYGLATPEREPMYRLRVANPQTLFDSKFLADDQSVFWQFSAVGNASGFHAAASATYRMAVAGAGDVGIHQTYRHFNYEPGKGQLAFITGTFAPEASCTKRVGLWNGSDGLFLQVDSSGPSIHIMNTAGPGLSAVQSAWNLDTLDGSGPSQIVLDMTKPQLLAIDYAWQGVGPVRFGFHISGQIHYVHRFQHANVLPGLFMATPNLPFRSQISSTGGSGTLDQYCATVISEGGNEQQGNIYAIQRPFASGLPMPANSAVVVLATRLKSTHLMMTSWPQSVKVHVAGGGTPTVQWQLILNPSIAGSALVWANMVSAATQYALGLSGNVATGGTVLDVGYVDFSTGAGAAEVVPQMSLRLGSQIDGTPDVLALVCTTDSTISARAALIMKDLL